MTINIDVNEDILYLNKEKQIRENLEKKIILLEYIDNICTGIVLEDRKDTILIFDEYGRNRIINRQDILDIDIDISKDLKEHMYKYYRQYKHVSHMEDECRFYKKQLEEIKAAYSKNYNLLKEYNKELQDIKEETLDVLGIYRYQEIHKKLSSMLKNDIKNYIIDINDRHLLEKITFNRLYTVAEEGTFDVKDLKFVGYFDDGGVYIEDSLLWSVEAKGQAEAIYSNFNNMLLKKIKDYKNISLEIEDRLILGGPIKDLTLEKNFSFKLLENIRDKKSVDKTILDIANFVNEYIN
jgi:hypothetical protein